MHLERWRRVSSSFLVIFSVCHGVPVILEMLLIAVSPSFLLFVHYSVTGGELCPHRYRMITDCCKAVLFSN